MQNEPYEFVAQLVHELRNPIAPLRNCLHILRMADADPSTRQIHDIMERQLGRMSRIIDDLMDVSRLILGQIELRLERVELAAVLRTAIESSKPSLDACDHQLAVSMPPQPLVLEAEPMRLAQVFTNLLNNAASYTDPGGQIRLNAHREGEEVVVSVRDNGIGIQQDMLPRVFELFTRIEGDSPRSKGGLGIGLTIARRLVELHGGRLEAFSNGPGQGSEFRVRLPLAPEQPAELLNDVSSQPMPATGLPTRRVLLVDDNEDTAKTLGMLLECIGLDVRVEHSGVAALEAIKQFHPHVVLLDLSMPGMDGFETARRIRQDAESQDVRLIALTGWCRPEDLRRTTEAGFDHHLVKPVKLETLESLIFV